ncbi:DNA polymerase III subunit delta [Bacillaceae bacterium W0354]
MLFFIVHNTIIVKKDVNERMHARQFIQKKNTKLAPIYVLYGEEAYFIQQVSEKIESLLKKVDDFDRNTYDMESVPVEEAILDAESFPLFTNHKLIIINRAFFLTGQQKKIEIEHELNALEEYVKNPADFSTVIIIAPYEKLDSRKKIVKTLKENCEIIDCSSPKTFEMHELAIDMAKSFQLKLDENIVELLIERVGERIEALRMELEKLSLYFEDNMVTYEVAEQMISKHSETSTFALIDAVTELNLIQSLHIIKELRKQNEEPIALLALLSSQIRLILQCKLLKSKGYQQQHIANQLQIHPYAVKMAMKREQRFSSNHLKQIIIEATNTDELIKTGKVEAWLAIELFIKKIITIQSGKETKSIKQLTSRHG